MKFIIFLAGLLILVLAYYVIAEAVRWFRNSEIVSDFMDEKFYDDEEESGQ